MHLRTCSTYNTCIHITHKSRRTAVKLQSEVKSKRTPEVIKHCRNRKLAVQLFD